MVQNEITFENLPKVAVYLASEVSEIKHLVCKGQTPVAPPKRIPIGRPLQKSTMRQKLLSLRNIRVLPFYKALYHEEGKNKNEYKEIQE